MTDDIIKSETNTESGNNSDSYEQALRLKHASILEQIRSIDPLITEVQAELSRTLKELYSNKNAYEETLNHIQALLEIETNGLPPIVSPIVKPLPQLEQPQELATLYHLNSAQRGLVSIGISLRRLCREILAA